MIQGQRNESCTQVNILFFRNIDYVAKKLYAMLHQEL